ncbi:hypothetical protein ACJZ2D_004943 [Fusarium nematophilum]
MKGHRRREGSRGRFGYGKLIQSPFPTVTSAFYHHARTCPDAIAVRDLSGSACPKELTYQELAGRAQHLAAQLIAQGVVPGSRVPLVVKRGLDMVVGIWAVLSCGAQYVPLDGGVVPDETIRQVMEQAAGGVVLCLASTRHHITTRHPAQTVVVIDEIDMTSYNLDVSNTHVDLSTADGGCYVIYTSAAWEIFACLCNGGTLVLRGSNWEPTLEQIDVLICTPTILSRYHPTQFRRIKTVATAALGAIGVMWAGGLGVSRGYIGLDDKTTERYKPDHFANDGSQIFNTGDLGRWRPYGSIEILGRIDDQVKVKGFRVELDGVSASLASAPSVSRAAALLIDGQIHGFTSPCDCDVTSIVKHVQQRQPYYAVPTHIHLLDDLPETANGKIDKKELEALALTRLDDVNPQIREIEKRSRDVEAQIELKSQSSMSTLSTVAEKLDLTRDMPEKQAPQPFRGLRHRIFIVYRTIFSLIGVLNLAALICVIALRLGSEWLGTITAINLAAAVLVRQDSVVNALYTSACSVPRRLPLWFRIRCAKIYHLGGLHSGAGVCATAWLVISTVRGTVCNAGFCDGDKAGSLATQVVSWLLCGLLCSMIATAWPSFRKQYHNLFERFHRFAGWTALAMFWIRTVLAINDSRPRHQDLGLAAVKSPDFWLLVVATCSIASSWFFLRKVPVEAEVLSDHAVRLHFDYTAPVNGSFTRISRRPLVEWHSFATIPNPEPTHHARGYSLVVSNAGDWTRACIQNPPSRLWVRGVPTCGVMRIATLFNRLVLIGTGSGIGPLLGHITTQPCPTQLIWSTPRPEETFGMEIVDTIRNNIPNAVIHDTKKLGRPDLVKMGYNLAKSFDAEAVIVIANEKITKKIVYGLETRGVPAFGAIWDS